MLWFEQMFGMVETVRICQVMWLVMLKYVKDQILGVDTTGEQVSPHVRYGMTCLLIRNTIGCVLIGGVGNGMVIRPSSHGERGAMVPCIYPGKH
jgi:hypothetical protein